MSRDWIIGAIAAAALMALGYWIASNTEWRDVTEPTPLKNEARIDPFYAAAGIVRQLDATAVSRQDLQALPPPGAVLVLTSQHWNLFPERLAALRRWVHDGGRLVLPENLIDDDDELGPWIGVRSRFHEPEKSKSGANKGDSPGKGESETREPADLIFNENDAEEVDFGGLQPRGRLCPKYAEKPSADSAAAQGAGRMLAGVTEYRVCGVRPRQTLALRKDAPEGLRPIWSIESKLGPIALRIADGEGSVTVLTGDTTLTWRAPIRAENGRFLVAITQLAPGDIVWFVSNEDADPLPLLMWRLGWPVIALLLAAFVLAMWRGVLRFGPLAAVPPAARRSLAEQIRGSAEFVLRHRRAAVLLAAELRALDEVASRTVRGWTTMDEQQRTAALARLARLDAGALGQARALPRTAPAHDVANAIAVLETVRRRLHPRAATAAPDTH